MFPSRQDAAADSQGKFGSRLHSWIPILEDVADLEPERAESSCSAVRSLASVSLKTSVATAPLEVPRPYVPLLAA